MIEQAKTLLKSKKMEDRLRAVYLLRNVGDSEALQLLVKSLRDRTHYIAAEAASLLGEIGNDSVAAEMVDAFFYLSAEGPKRDPGCHIRSKLAFAFGRLEFHHASDALRVGIRTRQVEPVAGVPFDTGAHLRATCALALAHLRSRDIIRDIVFLLFDFGTNGIGEYLGVNSGTDESRKAAAQALARLGDPAGAVPLSIKLVFPGNESPDVLEECMLALVELEDERAVELIAPYLQHHDHNLAAFAAVMLARTPMPEAVTLLADAIPGFYGDALRAVIFALPAMRIPESEALLQELAKDDRKAVRDLIAEVAPHLVQT